MILAIYNTAKALWSRANDWIKAPEPRATVPAFDTPEQAAAYMAQHIPYTGDPAGGAADFYLHPERLQAAIERGYVKTLAIDCDDFASWAYLATRDTGSRVLFTLRDGDGWGHHVICVGRDRLGPWAIDTSGYRRLPDQSQGTILRVFNEVFAGSGVRFVEAVSTSYPF